MANIIGTTAFDLLSRSRRNIGDVTTNLKLDWLNFINQEMYEIIAGIDEEQLMSERTYEILTTTNTYALPSDFQSMQHIRTGLFKVNTSGSTLGFLKYDAQTGNAVVGETITGGSSGATGIVQSQVDDGTSGSLTLNTISGTFTDDEALTGSTAFAATADGTYQTFDESEDRMAPTGRGSRSSGYYLDGSSNFKITPPEFQSTTSLLRLLYIPTLSNLTALSNTTQIPDRFRKFILKALEALFDEWKRDPNAEANANQRLIVEFSRFADEIRRIPRVYSLNDLSTSF